eukprot:3715434-Lingulodinium_polyedra.AAC.1
MASAKDRGVHHRPDFLLGSGAAVLCKPARALLRTRSVRAPFSGKAEMVMGTMALLRARWMFPLAEVWGAQPVRVSERLS